MTIGQLVNLLSNDVNRFNKGMHMVHYIYLAPIEVLVVTVIMWKNYFGPSTLAGMLLIFLYIPIQGMRGIH